MADVTTPHVQVEGWMGEAEKIAAEAIEDAIRWRQPRIVALVDALHTKGLLSDIDPDSQEAGAVLDALADLGLLHAREPKGGEPS